MKGMWCCDCKWMDLGGFWGLERERGGRREYEKGMKLCIHSSNILASAELDRNLYLTEVRISYRRHQ
jgi:hypothetical protein